MVHDIDCDDIQRSMDGDRSPLVRLNTKERRLRRSSSPGGVNTGLRASPSQNLLGSANSPRASPGFSGRDSPGSSSSNRGRSHSPMLHKEGRSSSDVMDDIPPPHAVAERYPGMSNSPTPMRQASEKALPAPGSSLERIFSADAVVEQLMRSQGNKPPLGGHAGQGPTSDSSTRDNPTGGSTSDDKPSTTTTTASTTTTNNNYHYPQQTTTQKERTKQRDSPTPMILERRGSFKIRTNEMGG